ncbi:hypothetical protein BH24CHL4_BH24CHL4_09850 [soil metagenome]
MICSSCGSAIESTDTFCSGCGAQHPAAVSQPRSQMFQATPLNTSPARRVFADLVVVLSCPVCGASAKPDDERCRCCGSYMFILTDLPKIDLRILNSALINRQIAEFRQAAGTNPTDATPHYGLGIAYFNLGLLEDSARELKIAAEIIPENPHIQLQLATVFAKLAAAGQPNFVEYAWDRVSRTLLLRPEMAEALILRAKLHRLRGSYSSAVADWRKIAETEPDAIRQSISRFLKANADAIRTAPGFGARSPLNDGKHVEKLLDTVLEFSHSVVKCLVGAVIAAMSAALLASFASETDGPLSALVSLGFFTSVLLVIVLLAAAHRRHRRPYDFRTRNKNRSLSARQSELMNSLLVGSASPDDLLASAEYVAWYYEE